MTWASDPKLRDGLHKPKFHEKGLQDMPCISGGKPYETGCHHLLEARELRGNNEKKCEESAAVEARPCMHLIW